MKSTLAKFIAALVISTFSTVECQAGNLCEDINQELKYSLTRIPAPGVTLSVLLNVGPHCSLAAGVTDVVKNLSAKPDSQFRIWSVSKTFTAAIILQLIDEGKLQLTDTLFDLETKFPNLYIDESSVEKLSNYPGSRKIQIKHLLSHSSGILD
ncbi:MAG: serine hydrolase, partial [Bdellovibrionota bacterium]